MIISLIIVIGLILRLLNLFSGKSLWGDEQFSMDLAQKPIQELIPLALKDVHPPLYPIISHLFSYNDITLRILSLLCGIGVIIGVYFLANLLCNKRTAFISSLLVAISPYWLQSSNEIRSYSLLACLVVWSTYFYFSGKKIAYAILAILAIYTEQTAWFWLIVLLFTTDFEWRDFWVCLIACIPALGVTIYQAIGVEHILDTSRVNEYLNFPMMSKKIFGLVDHLSCGYRYSMMNWKELLDHSNEFTFIAHILYSSLFLYLAHKGYKRVYNESLLFVSHFLFMWLIVPIVILGVFYPIRLDARYLSFCVPAFYILVANGFLE